MASKMSFPLLQGPAFFRIAPFAAFMLFIAAEELLALLQKAGMPALDEGVRLWLYVPKMALAGALLIFFRRRYQEIDLREVGEFRSLLFSIAIGIVIFILWINMDWSLGAQNAPRGFDPGSIASEPGRWVMITLRCMGAVLVVPVMEELFWRSFLLRWMIDSNFTAVAVGRLSWPAILATTVLFGLEHHYLFAGMMAGALLTLVYWRTRSIVHCIVCHAVANLALAVYVLTTSQWQFW